ncbi:MAG: pyridoxal phosphate-dependent aminotransferase [Bacteroidales bacterium]|jgi:aspartate aminotransferase|nr:pyridoxal phosphate-dependent aminotransferase [Bacteroidales bacterium]
MSQISARLLSLSESATLAMSQKSRELQAQGLDIVNLGVGEPDFNTPEHIKAAAIKAINDNQTHYPPVPGYPELRKAVCERLKRDLNLDYEAAQIIVSAGGKHSLANAILAVINPGDEVIIPAPYWVTYTELVKLAEGKSVIVNCDIEQDFKMTPAQLEAAITPRTRMLIINSPSNPTGSMYSAEELEGLAKVLRKHKDIIVLSDEIYDMITYGQKHASLAQCEGLKDQVILCNGLSKGYAMTGWRCGYIAAPLDIAKACNKLQGQFTSGICTITQYAAIAALTQSDEPSRKMTAEFHKRRDLVLQLLAEIPGLKTSTPPGAFYVFPNVSAYLGKKFGDKVIANSMDLAMYLLTEGHVATVAGSAFGLEGYIRLSYAASEDKLRTAVERIKKALAALK